MSGNRDDNLKKDFLQHKRFKTIQDFTDNINGGIFNLNQHILNMIIIW